MNNRNENLGRCRLHIFYSYKIQCVPKLRVRAVVFTKDFDGNKVNLAETFARMWDNLTVKHWYVLQINYL